MYKQKQLSIELIYFCPMRQSIDISTCQKTDESDMNREKTRDSWHAFK